MKTTQEIMENDLEKVQIFYIVKECLECLEETTEAWSEYYTEVNNFIFKMDELIKIWDKQSENYSGNTEKQTLEKYKWKIFLIWAEFCSEEWLDDDGYVWIKEVFPKEITKIFYFDNMWNEVI